MGANDSTRKLLKALEKLIGRYGHPALLEAEAAVCVQALAAHEMSAEEALAVVENAARDLPGSTMLQECLSKALVEMSRRSSDPRLRARSQAALEKVLEQKCRELIEGKLRLARLHRREGKDDAAMEELSAIVAFDPANADARRMIEDLSPDAPARPVVQRYDLERLTGEAARIKGFLAAVVVNPAGVVLAADNRLSVDTEQLAETMIGLVNNARGASRQMDVGAFERAEFEGPMGRIFVAALGEDTFLSVFDRTAKGEAGPSRIEHLVTSCVVRDDVGGSNP